MRYTGKSMLPGMEQVVSSVGSPRPIAKSFNRTLHAVFTWHQVVIGLQSLNCLEGGK